MLHDLKKLKPYLRHSSFLVRPVCAHIIYNFIFQLCEAKWLTTTILSVVLVNVIEDDGAQHFGIVEQRVIWNWTFLLSTHANPQTIQNIKETKQNGHGCPLGEGSAGRECPDSFSCASEALTEIWEKKNTRSYLTCRLEETFWRQTG